MLTSPLSSTGVVAHNIDAKPNAVNKLSAVGFRICAVIVSTVLVAGLSGCVSNVTKKEETLSSLDSQVVKVNPQSATNIVGRKDARVSYKEFANSTNNEALRIRAMERLADLEMESTEDKITRKTERKEKAAKNLGTPIDIVQPEKEDTADYTAVAEQYEGLLKRQSNQKKNESVLYQLARAYDLSGQWTKSLETLTRLINQYPNTKRLEEIQFRRGELLFQLKDYKGAEEAYTAVLANDDSPYYERSIYKQGWSIFKLNDLPRALESFYQLLDAKFKGEKSMKDFSNSERNLLDDTFRIVSLIFSSMDGYESIREYTRKVGRRTYEYQIYTRLSKLYLDQERFDDAAKTLNTYVELYPNNTHSPEMLVQVIDIYEKGGFASSLIKAKGDFVTRYGIGNTFWSQEDPGLLAKITPFIKKNLADLAKHFHSLGQKSKNVSDYKVAAHWYREYVKSFPSEPETASMNFLLAENLSESKNYAEAAIEYENTAYKYGKHKDAAEAGYAAILAYQQQITADLKGEEKLEKRKRAVASAIQFSEIYPKDKRVPAVLLKAAEEYLDFKQMDLAAITAHKVVSYKTKESKKLEKPAYAIIAVAEFSLGNHKKAELATIRRLMMMAPDAKDRNTYVERLAAAVYKQGEEARDAGNLELAANHFLRLGSLAPNSKIRVTSEYDGASALLKMEAWDRAIPVLQNIMKSFPGHKLAASAVAQLALAYEKQEKWDSAADMYTEIAKTEKDPERQRGLLWQTASLYVKSGKLEKSIEAYKAYISKYSEPLEQAIEARQIIADTYISLRKLENRDYWLKDIIAADKAGKSTERTTYLAAQAALELAGPTYRRYHKVQLVKPLKENLKKKKQLLKESVEEFTLAANYGVAEFTTAATYKIAEIYNEFSKGLFASERPAGLSPEELEQYDILLEEQAFPFEEKAIDVHESNALRVTAGIYDKWVQRSLHSLRSLQPIRYAKNERSELLTVDLN